jgi:hypothetical protein
MFDNGPDVEKLKRLIDEAGRWSINLDVTTIGYNAGTWVTSLTEKLRYEPENMQLIEQIDQTLEALAPLNLSLDLWKAQNIYFSIGKDFYTTMKTRAADNDDAAKHWIHNFLNLGRHLHVKI